MKLFLLITRQLLLSTTVVLAALVLPIVMTIVVSHVPFRALMLGFWWPALVGSGPATTFMIMPVAVSVALVWSYGTMANDGIIAVLYSSRLSPFALLRPALLFMLLYTAGGYALGLVIAPATSGYLHDTIYTIREGTDPRLMEEGKVYEMPEGTSAISFDRWIGPWEVEKVFVRERLADGTERLIVAERAQFIKTDDSLFVLLKRGRIHSMKPGSKAASSGDFEQIAQPLGIGGTNKIRKREWRGVYEMSLSDFMKNRSDPHLIDMVKRHYASEAVKRFVVPVMSLTHSLLALGLLLTFGPLTGRRGLKPIVVALICVGLHTGAIALAEGLSTLTPYSPGLMGLLVTAEGGIGLALLARQQFGPLSLLRAKLRRRPVRLAPA